MNSSDMKRLRKSISLLKDFRDKYARSGNNVISTKFARAAAILIEILEEEKDDGG